MYNGYTLRSKWLNLIMKIGGPGPLGPWNMDPIYVIHIHGLVLSCIFFCVTHKLKTNNKSAHF